MRPKLHSKVRKIEIISQFRVDSHPSLNRTNVSDNLLHHSKRQKKIYLHSPAENKYHLPNRVLLQFVLNWTMKVILNVSANVKVISNTIDLGYDPCFVCFALRRKTNRSRTSNKDQSNSVQYTSISKEKQNFFFSFFSIWVNREEDKGTNRRWVT